MLLVLPAPRRALIGGAAPGSASAELLAPGGGAGCGSLAAGPRDSAGAGEASLTSLLAQPSSLSVPSHPSLSTTSEGMFSRAQVRRALQQVPGKQRLGVYRFLPFFFVLGGVMEWIMIRVRVGQETFYDVYRRKASERQYQRRLEDASEIELQQSTK